MNITYRPISTWPGERTPDRQRRSTPFKASWYDTQGQLERELRLLGAESALLEMGLEEHQISVVTGLPKAKSRQPGDPGIIISFESKHGPMRYATDVFTTWQANVRAVALGLEALRRVDRYGITKRGEQYAGWRQIEAASQSSDQARDVLRGAIRSSIGGDSVMFDGADDALLTKLARRATHPDAGGRRESWDAVQHAAETLGVA